jgi:hypothetical protein
MASRGVYEKGTDGSDHLFRQRVDNVYLEGSYYKKKLVLVGFAHTAALVLSMAITFLLGPKVFPFHQGLLLALLLPVISHKALKTNHVAIMTVYSFACGFVAAYLTWLGIGRCLDTINAEGLTVYDSISVLANSILVTFLLTGSYYSRKLIDMWRMAAFNRELRAMKTAHKDS